MEDYDCEHLEVFDDTCQDCGHMMESIADVEKYTGDNDGEFFGVSKSKKREKFSYLDELSGLKGIDSAVRREVYEKIKQMEPKRHIRLATHKKTLFTFIYVAYNTLGKPFDPAKLGADLGLTPKQIRLAVKSVSVKDTEDSTKVQNPICMIPPEFYFEGLADGCEEIHVFKREELNQLTDLSNLVLESNPMMYNERPRGIAATLMKMFLEHNKLLSADFYTKCGMTPGYIKGVEGMIIGTLNSISSDSLDSMDRQSPYPSD